MQITETDTILLFRAPHLPVYKLTWTKNTCIWLSALLHIWFLFHMPHEDYFFSILPRSSLENVCQFDFYSLDKQTVSLWTSQDSIKKVVMDWSTKPDEKNNLASVLELHCFSNQRIHLLLYHVKWSSVSIVEQVTLHCNIYGAFAYLCTVISGV